MAAIDGKVTVVMKTGRMVEKGSGEMGFEGDMAMTHALAELIDVSKAEAAVKADEEMIKGQAERMPGGLEGINRRATSAIGASRTSMKEPAIQAAACGDDALGIKDASQTQLDEWAKAAAGGGYRDLLRKLLDRGARVGVVVKGDLTAVMAAAFNGQLEALRMCLAAPDGEAAVNVQNSLGETALAVAAASGSAAEAKLLLEHGADVHLANNKGNTPLIRAAMASGDTGLEATEVLLAAGAKVDHQDKEGTTALHFACLCSNVEVVKLLLERGADPLLKNELGRDAMAFAGFAAKKDEVMAVLRARMGGK